jgi:hypothetical protein
LQSSLVCWREVPLKSSNKKLPTVLRMVVFMVNPVVCETKLLCVLVFATAYAGFPPNVVSKHRSNKTAFNLPIFWRIV